MKPLAHTLAVAAVATLSACTHMQPPTSTQPSPVVAWNQITMDTIERVKPSQHQAIRLHAYVSLAQYAALVDAKNKTAMSDTVATASARVLAELAAPQAAYVRERLNQSGANETQAGRNVARYVLTQAHSDEFARKFTGQVPQGADQWRSLANPAAPPAFPVIGEMRMFLIDSGNVFRSPPPPAMDSARFKADLAEVKRVTDAPTAETTRLARFYDMTTGTLAAGFWNVQAAGRIRANHLNDLQAARVLATMNTAMMDAVAACHDTKYTYWVPRPSQAEPAIKALIGVPNHPAYPSNHSCISTSAALVLAHFFPQDRRRLEAFATEAGVSRIYAGLHYRFDVEAGEAIGRQVAAVAVTRHNDMLARWTQTVVAQRTAP
jgi:hypothetical protein